MKDTNQPKVLLINPYVHDFKLYDEWMKPISLYYLAYVLRKNGVQPVFYNFNPRYHESFPLKYAKSKLNGTGDFHRLTLALPPLYEEVPRIYKRYGLSESAVIKDLKNMSYNYAGIFFTSLMTYWYQGVWDSASLVAKVFPDVPKFLGGVYASLCNDHAKQCPDFNWVQKGNLIHQDLIQIWRIMGFHETPVMPDHVEWDYDIDSEQYYLPIMISTGCPFRCTYCASHFLKPEHQFLDQDYLMDYIQKYYSKGIRDICFYDDALLFRFDENLGPLLERILTRNLLGLRFHTPNGMHARFIDKEVAKILYKAGFQTIRLGYETSDNSLQMKIGAKVDNSLIIGALQRLKESGFNKQQIGTYLMFGLPGQTLEYLESAIHLLSANGSKIMPVCFSPIPFTEEFQELKSIYPFIEKEPLTHNDLFFCFKANFLSYEQFFRLKKICLKLNNDK